MSAQDGGLQYRITFTDPRAHLVDVELRFTAGAGQSSVTLWMPVWTPGSYLVREFSRNVESFRAEASDGRTLPWRKTRKNRWEILTEGAPEIRVTYRVYGREMTVRTNWIDSDFALLNGAATFLTVEGREHGPHRIRVELPRGWSGVWTSLSSEDGAYVAHDLDEVVDSPLLVGSPAVHDFEVDGKPVSLVNVGEGGLWDGAKAAGDVKAVVEGYRDMYGSLPFPRYLFLNLITESRGGLEHKGSSVLMTSRYAYRVRKSYVDWLGLVSHEFFHVWNVKRSRPEALGPFDYENEVYTRSLWVAEGLTNYYTDLLPRRTGLTTVEEYLEKLSRHFDTVQNTPGRLFASLEASSFDAWIKLYRPDENSANTTISYYVKGAVVGWLLDAAIRGASGGERSLDDLMRLLYERYAGERGYSDGEIQAAAEETAGRPLDGFFDRHVRGTDELDYAPALAHFGLRFRDPRAGQGNGAPSIQLGFETREEQGRLVVKAVRRDGPAREGGLNAGDEILAVGGYRVTPETFTERLLQYAPGDRLDILVARREAIRIVPVTAAGYPGAPWRLEIDPEASEEAAAARAAWLGAD
jgi:predicted metalloprotease with PDZ domain